jgi:iron complex transport system substrate-binding protein
MRNTPDRVVSLYPSMTRTIVDFGFIDRLVGVTEYCVLENGSPPVVKVGGVRAPDIGMVRDLRPDLVIANQEENGLETIEALLGAGLNVWVTFPCSVEDAVQVMYDLGEIFHARKEVSRQIALIEAAIDWLRASHELLRPRRVFCPVWYEAGPADREWWMTANRDTYLHSVLELCGGLNVFADRQRRYPLDADLGRAESEDPAGRDTRYPRVTRAEIEKSQPELFLLPDEPFSFENPHIEAMKDSFPDTPAVEKGDIYIVDGRWLTWHGSMLAAALASLPSFLDLEGFRDRETGR